MDTHGRDEESGGGNTSGLKQGYIEIHPLTADGPGLRVSGFDVTTRQPVPGCIETAMDDGDDLLSAVLDVNHCMKEQGYSVVKDFTHYLDFSDESGSTQLTELETGDSNMPKSVANMTDAQFKTYIEQEREAIDRNAEALRTAEASEDDDTNNTNTTTDTSTNTNHNSDESPTTHTIDYSDFGATSTTTDTTDTDTDTTDTSGDAATG